MMDDKAPAPEFIGNVRHEPATEEQRQRPISEQMDDAVDLLKSQRGGEPVSRDRERVRDVPTVEDAHESLKSEQEEARQQADREAERAEQQQREQAEREVQEAATWNESDQRELAERQSWMEVHEEGKRKFRDAQRWAAQNADTLSDTDRQYLAQQAQQLQKQEKFLQNASAEVQQASRYKQLQAEQRRLFRDVPELKSEANREKLIQWAVENKGVTEEAARAEQRRSVIAQAWQEMQAEEKEARKKHLERARKPVIRGKGMPERMTINDARERLQRNNSMDDAVNLLALQRERSKEMSDDS